jgi:hypothetical protein
MQSIASALRFAPDMRAPACFAETYAVAPCAKLISTNAYPCLIFMVLKKELGVCLSAPSSVAQATAHHRDSCEKLGAWRSTRLAPPNHGSLSMCAVKLTYYQPKAEASIDPRAPAETSSTFVRQPSEIGVVRYKNTGRASTGHTAPHPPLKEISMAPSIDTNQPARPIADRHFRWCALRSDFYLGFWVHETETGFEETFCTTVYKFEPEEELPNAPDEWGIVIRRGTETYDVDEIFGSIEEATTRVKALLFGAPAVLTPVLA